MPLFHSFADTVKKWIATGGTLTLPTGIRVLLSSTVPNADGTNITAIGAGLTNPIQLIVGTTEWTTSSAGSGSSNKLQKSFGTATGAATVNAIVFRYQDDTNIGFVDISGSPITIQIDDPVIAEIGALTFNINPQATGDWFDYLVDMLINALFTGTALTQPTSIEMTFSTDTPDDNGTYTETVGITPASLACNGTNWDATISGGAPLTNLVQNDLGTVSSPETITYMILRDHLGNDLIFEQWSKTTQTGQPITVEPGQAAIDIN